LKILASPLEEVLVSSKDYNASLLQETKFQTTETMAAVELVLAESYSSLLTVNSLLLRNRGYTVKEITCTAELIKYFTMLNDEKQPDVLIIDPYLVDMQGSDTWGMETIYNLRDKFPTLSIIVLSGHPRCVELAELCGSVDVVLTKPVSSTALDNTIKHLLQDKTMH
jgi:CheY-like chemotaxis protein